MTGEGAPATSSGRSSLDLASCCCWTCSAVAPGSTPRTSYHVMPGSLPREPKNLLLLMTRAKKMIPCGPGASKPCGVLGLGFCVMAFELTGQVEKHLVNDHIVWLTTVTPAGRPAPRPVWFVWDGTATTRPSALPRNAPGAFRSKAAVPAADPASRKEPGLAFPVAPPVRPPRRTSATAACRSAGPPPIAVPTSPWQGT